MRQKTATAIPIKIEVRGSERFADCLRSFLKTLKPPPPQTVSQWADAERRLSSESSAEPGPWDTNRAPYLRDIMDAINDPGIRKIVVKKAAQVGWTETINNYVAYYIARDPAPMLVIQPTLEMAQAWSKDRLAPMIRDTPALRGKVKDAKTRDADNTILHKSFNGGHLTVVGANSPSSLASRPIRIVLADEVDRYPVSAGTEGDPLTLAAKRQITFWNAKTVLGSTATVKNASVIDREWLASDQRKFFVPCPDCGHEQDLRWEQVHWDKTGEGDNKVHHPETAHYVCEECGSLWDDVTRIDAITKGSWRATKPEVVGIAGFLIPGFLSSWLTLEGIAREFLSARHDPALLQVFINTVIGDVWEEAGETVDASSFIGRREVYDHETLPPEIQAITAGVDTQDDRLEVQLVAWGEGEESWPFAYEVIRGDPAQKEIWGKLDDLLLRSFRTEDGLVHRIKAACIDSGGHHSAAVLSFCRTRRARRIFATKGQSGARMIWPKNVSKAKNSEQVFMIGVDTAKEAIYGRLKIKKPGKGFVHFPHIEEFDQEYFNQLTAESVVTRHREGRPYRVWVARRPRNEALDTFVLALAALRSTKLKLDTDRRKPNAMPAPAPSPAARPTREPQERFTSPQIEEKKPIRRRSGGFLGGGSLLGKRGSFW